MQYKKEALVTVVEPGTLCSYPSSIAHDLADQVPWFIPSKCRQCKNLAPER